MEDNKDEALPEEMPEAASTEPQMTNRERKDLKKQEREQERKSKEMKRQTKRVVWWIGIIGIIGGIIYGMVWLAQNAPEEGSATGSLAQTVSAEDWVKGNPDATVTLLEYSDLQCPACGAYYPIVKQVAEDFGDDIRFVYRHFPLRQIHLNADFAARATEAAGLQGMFWEMHDLIFESQRDWSNQSSKVVQATFSGFAGQLALDVTQFEADMASEAVKDAIDADFQSGLKSKVNSTPTFYLNGEKIQNPRNYEDFANLINQALGNTTTDTSMGHN